MNINDIKTQMTAGLQTEARDQRFRDAENERKYNGTTKQVKDMDPTVWKVDQKKSFQEELAEYQKAPKEQILTIRDGAAFLLQNKESSIDLNQYRDLIQTVLIAAVCRQPLYPETYTQATALVENLALEDYCKKNQISKEELLLENSEIEDDLEEIWELSE